MTNIKAKYVDEGPRRLPERVEAQCIGNLLRLDEIPTKIEEKQRADKMIQQALGALGVSFARIGYLLSKSEGPGIRMLSRETIVNILGWEMGREWKRPSNADIRRNRAMVTMRAFNLWLYELADLFESMPESLPQLILPARELSMEKRAHKIQIVQIFNTAAYIQQTSFNQD